MHPLIFINLKYTHTRSTFVQSHRFIDVITEMKSKWKFDRAEDYNDIVTSNFAMNAETSSI